MPLWFAFAFALQRETDSQTELRVSEGQGLREELRGRVREEGRAGFTQPNGVDRRTDGVSLASVAVSLASSYTRVE